MAVPRNRVACRLEPDQLKEISAAVPSGRFERTSQFLRVAIDQKLTRLREEHVRTQLEQFCDESDSNWDGELVGSQAFGHAGPI